MWINLADAAAPLCQKPQASPTIDEMSLKACLARTAAAVCFLLVCCAPGQTRAAAPLSLGEQNEFLRPPIQEGLPVPVSIAIRVLNLTDIDEVAQRFHLMFYMFVQWHDSRLAFTPHDPNEHFHAYTPNEVWHPRLEFINGIGARTVSEVSLRASPDGKALYIERSDVELSTRFHLHRFPFDRQELQIIVRPFVGQATILRFEASHEHTWISAGESTYSSLAEWDLKGTRTEHDHVSMSKLGPIPQAYFEIIVKRKYDFYLWKIFLPLILMVMLSWTVYWIDTRDLNSQVQISITTILTVIAFAFSISISLPRVPYLTYIDAFFLDCLVFVFFTAIEMTTVHVSARTQRHHIGLKIRRISRVAVPIAFVLSNAIVAIRYFR
jgi:Neurotransmitter-gated ion-channel ligand binding domain/Neurotransmitter-gated ion-channel transmembrane region